MVWTVVGLDESDRARVEDRVDLLEQLGPALGRPDHKRQLASKDKRHGHQELERHQAAATDFIEGAKVGNPDLTGGLLFKDDTKTLTW